MGSKAANKTSSWHLNGFPSGSITLGQQHNIGEKPTVILYAYINRHAGTPEKQRIQKHCSTSSNMVVIIYCYIGCEDKATKWYSSTQLIEVVNTLDLGQVLKRGQRGP